MSECGDNDSRTIYGIKKKKQRKEVVFYTHFEEKINPFGPYQIFAVIVILYASIEWAGLGSYDISMLNNVPIP
ncbi:hypothetical protein ANCDUO_08189 [Ancylostoma duodenale]|uniref:Uncharacterized protein n=1 Tax=Ancylostoma duodenale TaxID=51022 RepID=A0A0C2GJZ4_9BILA|nr:hypothetical protein ANCDUO_08189 [Ancylostoma duodenale]